MEMTKYKLGDLCKEFHSGKGILAAEISDSGRYPVYGGNGLRGYTDRYNQDGSYLIIGRQGAYCGNVRYNVGKAFLTEHAIVGQTKNGHNAIYLAFKLSLMNLAQFQGQSAQPGLSVDTLSKIELLMPSRYEQDKIAKILVDLDDKIALNKKMNQKLEAMAKRLYDYWFVQYDFPDKNGHPYKTTGGPMTYNPTLKREIPAGWEVKQICDIASFEKESVRPSDNPNIEYKHFSIPGYDECGSYVLETGESILSDKFKVSETDVLVSKLNPWTSRVIWGESREHQICSTEFVVMKLHELKEKGFLYSLVKQPSFIDYCTRGSSGTSHSHRRVNPEYMMDYIFAYDEDAVQSFSAIVSRYALMMMKNLRENRRLTALRDKLLPLLMNGQVTVA